MKTFLRLSRCRAGVAAGVAAVGFTLFLMGCASAPDPQPLCIVIEGEDKAEVVGIPVYVGSADLLYYPFLLGNLDEVMADLRRGIRPEVTKFNLTAGKTTIPVADAHWKTWLKERRADQVVVIADLPANLGGDRRVSIPLDHRGWADLKDQTVHVRIKAGGVQLVEVAKPN